MAEGYATQSTFVPETQVVSTRWDTPNLRLTNDTGVADEEAAAAGQQEALLSKYIIQDKDSGE